MICLSNWFITLCLWLYCAPTEIFCMLCSIYLAHFLWPHSLARSSGVCPLQSLPSSLAPTSISNFKHWTWPSEAAWWTGVMPSLLALNKSKIKQNHFYYQIYPVSDGYLQKIPVKRRGKFPKPPQNWTNSILYLTQKKKKCMRGIYFFGPWLCAENSNNLCKGNLFSRKQMRDVRTFLSLQNMILSNHGINKTKLTQMHWPFYLTGTLNNQVLSFLSGCLYTGELPSSQLY